MGFDNNDIGAALPGKVAVEVELGLSARMGQEYPGDCGVVNR